MFEGQQVLGRDGLLGDVSASIAASRSAWLIGHRFSGRTSLLRELRRRLEDEDRTCIWIPGVVGLGHLPLSALSMAWRDSRMPKSPASVTDAATQLRNLVRSGSTVILIDDADHVDDVSGAVIGAIANEQNCPIVATSLVSNGHPQALLSGVHGLTHRVPAIEFNDLEAILRNGLGAPVEVDTMSRVFAKSSGIVGVACAIAEAAMLDGRLVRMPRSRVLRAREGLWSPRLEATVAAFLDPLKEEDRETLMTVAMGGLLDLSTARAVTSSASIESLERRGLLQVTVSGGRQIVSIVPALVVEYVRNERSPLLRTRLAEQLAAHAGNSEIAARATSDLVELSQAGERLDPVLVRLHMESLQSTLISASARWNATPTAGTAVTYARALLAAGSAPERVDELLSTRTARTDDPDDRLAHVTLHAEWLAIGKGDLAAGLSLLHNSQAEADPAHARRLEAAAVRLQCLMDGVPDDFESRLSVAPADAPEVQIDLREAAALGQLSLGRLADARRTLEALPTAHLESHRTLANDLFGWLLLAEGAHAQATDWSRRGLDCASRELDTDSMLRHAYLGSTLAVFSGDYSRADQIISRVIAVGAASPLLAHTELGLWVIGTILAVRRGSLAVAERFLRGLGRHRVAFGPMMGQSLVVAAAQMDAYQGEVDRAVEDIWAEGERAWSRGHKLAALQLKMMSAEIRMTPDRLDDIRSCAEEVEGDFLHSFLEFLVARERQDAHALLRAAPRLTDTGRPGLAAIALDLAEQYSPSGKRAHEEVSAARQRLSETTGGRRLDKKRLLVAAVTLTEREREIVDLIVRGMGNSEIAARLVLSVRTVESHLTRILRKSGTRTRDELIEQYSQF